MRGFFHIQDETCNTMKFLPCHISSEQMLSEEACKNLIEKYDTKVMAAGITTKGLKNPTVRKAFSRSVSLEDSIDINTYNRMLSN